MGLLGKPTILGCTPTCCQRGMNPAIASGEDETQQRAPIQSDRRSREDGDGGGSGHQSSGFRTPNTFKRNKYMYDIQKLL